jgi:hypothetical protein
MLDNKAKTKVKKCLQQLSVTASYVHSTLLYGLSVSNTVEGQGK